MAWSLVNTWTYSSSVAQVDFTGLAGYSDIRVLVYNVTLSNHGIRSLRVSTDNGSTFLSTTADYINLLTDGTEIAGTSMGFHGTTNMVARSGEIEICGFNLTNPKVAQKVTRTDSRSTIIPTTSPLNAVRIFDTTGGYNLTGGNIYVYGR